MHDGPLKERAGSGVELDRSGLLVGGEVVPLLSGSVHYWRLPRERWRPALQALQDLGLRLVDTYVPWSVHERAPGLYDFGEDDPQRDVVAFLNLARELGLLAIVRPGPHIGAELTYFGIPVHVIWNEACQARSPRGKPVVLPAPPLAFPVPSYASDAFFSEASAWLEAVGRRLAPLQWPQGPVVLCQVDNAGAMYFRDGVYDQDYHPDAVRELRRFLRAKYSRPAAIARAWGVATAGFDEVTPPSRSDIGGRGDLARHLDWAEFQEVLLARALSRFRRSLEQGGLAHVPTSHNLPAAESSTPLDPARLGTAVDFVALDYHHRASSAARAEVARRTSELVTRADVSGTPAFAASMWAGFPAHSSPSDTDDDLFTAMTALAYGLRGFNVYMAVGRDRWIGAPIDEEGWPTAAAERWRGLVTAVERTRLFELERRAAVHVVVPRSLRRLLRVFHAFGPLSRSVVHAVGLDPEAALLEPDTEGEAPPVRETAVFLRRLEAALEAARLPFVVTSGDLIDAALGRGRWVIVPCAGGLERHVLEALSRQRDGLAVSFGPRMPDRPVRGDDALEGGGGVPVHIEEGRGAVEAAVQEAARALGLAPMEAEPQEISTTLLCDAEGRSRVLFVINPTRNGIQARVLAPGAESARDALSEERFRVESGHLALQVPPRSVRMLELSAAP